VVLVVVERPHEQPAPHDWPRSAAQYSDRSLITEGPRAASERTIG
jgi:hypothetical protein